MIEWKSGKESSRFFSLFHIYDDETRNYATIFKEILM